MGEYEAEERQQPVVAAATHCIHHTPESSAIAEILEPSRDSHSGIAYPGRLVKYGIYTIIFQHCQHSACQLGIIEIGRHVGMSRMD